MSLVNWHGIHHSKEERSSIRSFLENPKPFRFSFVQLGSLHKIGHKISNSATLNLLTFAAASAAISSRRVSYRRACHRGRGSNFSKAQRSCNVRQARLLSTRSDQKLGRRSTGEEATDFHFKAETWPPPKEARTKADSPRPRHWH